MKGYSIITNFGCKTSCPYCIWKNHALNGYSIKSFDFLKSVKQFIKSKKMNKFSVSGGGDPLNDFEYHLDFWKLLIDSNKQFDIHTSYIEFDNFQHKLFGNSINRIIFHTTTDKLSSQFWDIFRFSLLYKIRVNFVVTSELNIYIAEKFEKFASNHNIQVSYREHISINEFDPLKLSSTQTFISDFCKNVNNRYVNGKYVYQNDYNIYLMPDGNVYNKFLF